MPSGTPNSPQRVLIIGAHHGVGAHALRIARARGFDATAFSGDVVDREALNRALVGKDAVLSTLGPRGDAPADLCARGTANIVAAMKTNGVRRIVQVTGAMIGHPREKLGWMYRIIAAFVPESQLDDRRAQERILRESGLETTIVRPTRLTDAPPRGRWRDGEDEVVGAWASIAREDVAEALVRALEDPRSIGRAWTLQY